MRERQTDEHIQSFYVDSVKFIRLPFNPYQYRYYMKINDANIRISKDLYRSVKLQLEALHQSTELSKEK